MTSAPQTLWRAILFYRIMEMDRRLLAWLLIYNRKYADLAQGFDSPWLRWLATACALLMLCYLNYGNTVYRQAGTLASIGFGFLFSFYFCKRPRIPMCV